MPCITYDFNLDEQGWDLNSGSTGGTGVFSESYDNTYKAIKIEVELGSGNSGTFNGNISTTKAPNLNTLTWEEIGVPSGSYVTDVSVEFEYSVLITEESQVVEVAPVVVAYDDLAEDETLLTAKTLNVGVDFNWGVKSAPVFAGGSPVVLPTPDLASKGVGIILGYAIGQQSTVSQVDTIWYSNVRICANYSTEISTDDWDGSTSSLFDLGGLAEIAAKNLSGSTNAVMDIDGYISLLTSGWDGSTTSFFNAQARGVLQIIFNGRTSVSKLDLIGLYELFANDWDGSTSVNQAIATSLAGMLSDNWEGSTSSGIGYTAIGDIGLSISGSTNATMNIEDATGGIRNMVTDNWSGKTNALINIDSSVKISTDDWDGSTSAGFTLSKLEGIQSDGWSGSTNASLTLIARAVLSSDDWSGSTDFEIAATSDTDGSTDDWSGSTSMSIDGTKLFNGSTDDWSGTTNFTGVIEDGNAGVKDMYVSWSGETTAEKLLPEPSILSLSTDNWSGTTRMQGSICNFEYWQIGSVKVNPELICEAYIGDVKVFC